MNIQLSTTLWTIICFVLLILILHHLLFKPILKVIDGRRTRVRNAALKKAEHARIVEANAAALQEKEAARLAQQHRQIKEQIETIRMDGKKAVEAAKGERLRTVDDYRQHAAAERAEILRILSGHADELAAYFAESVTEG